MKSQAGEKKVHFVLCVLTLRAFGSYIQKTARYISLGVHVLIKQFLVTNEDQLLLHISFIELRKHLVKSIRPISWSGKVINPRIWALLAMDH